MPVLILNETAKYSENGEADQKVIAVSYGRFKYNYLIHKDTNEASGSGSFMEVVGVSRIGKDGRKDYYVLVPFYPDVSLEGKDTENFDFYQWLEEIKDKENQKPVTFSEFGFMDETYAIALDKIPKDLREFYAQAFFSDAYLREVVSKNYRVTGSVTCSEGVPKINASDKSEPGMIIDLEAARYAGKHDAEDLSFFKLDSEASFIEFYRYQDGIVRAILDKEKEESKLESKASPKVEQNDGKPNEIEELGEI